MGQIRNKNKYSDRERITELKKLLTTEFKFKCMELNHVIVGDITRLINVISKNNAIIMPNKRIHDLNSNVCRGNLIGAEYIIYLVVRLESEDATYNLSDISEQITTNFITKNEWKTLNGTTGSCYVHDTDFRADNLGKLRLFSCSLKLHLNY